LTTAAHLPLGVSNPLPSIDQLDGYTVFILSFLMTSGPSDEVLAFTELDSETRAKTIAEYHSNGISLMISAFGADDTPSRTDPVDTANMVADFVKEYKVSPQKCLGSTCLTSTKLDGTDVDFEDYDSFNSGSAEKWIISFTKQLRSRLPAGGECR
jgi:chitinase